ncbi:MAG: hypothetical protein ACD_71C00007G0003 [uncultured bacterium (gcode 4)]|uniref:SMODS and SLOG-associating 2TM effector domain-containing protein n=1 Tax=uncultured bacterium (gcode 4) TaxID=1234023 RepID=K1Z6D5_9BACT|nr:MAG: hypothetical protein ACD_71C00007G0003 [uncultured bacterium (gcode 4)]
MNTNLENLIQNRWQNLALQHKSFFKSHDLSLFIQIGLLITPILLSLWSLTYDGPKYLDFIAMCLSIFALIYFINYWKNQELYMEWWEKYLVMYKEIETAYKQRGFTTDWLLEFDVRLNILNTLKKPPFHVWAKVWADHVVRKETMYANENKPWWE